MKKLFLALVGCLVISSALKAEKSTYLTTGKKLALFTVVGHFSLRQISDTYRKFTDDAYDTVKDTLLHKIVAPIVEKVERVKDEGVSRDDLIQSAAVLGTTGGLLYHLDLLKGDIEKTSSIVGKDIQFIRDHKLFVGLSSFVVGLTVLSYLEGINMTNIQRFLRSLTYHQRDAIAQCDHMTRVLDGAHDDPLALRDHDKLQELLHEHQKDLLDKAIQDYLIHSDPLSLLDDFDDL